MLAGLGPLLGNGICGYFINNKDKKSSWVYRDGIAGVDSVRICEVKEAYKIINGNNPIAVLTSSQTASSGEVVVTSFRGKTNVKSLAKVQPDYQQGTLIIL
jgi:carboxyl-terminal processing protease